MNQIQQKIEKLLAAASEQLWENCSYYNTSHSTTYGRPSPAWNAWAGRIGNLLKETVKPDSEPFAYFNTARATQIEGNLKDKFDFAKQNYLKSLLSLQSLILEGDVFDDLLASRPAQTDPTPKAPPPKAVANQVAAQSNKKVFIVHGHDHTLKIELEVFLSHIGLKPVVLHREADNGQTIIEKFEMNSDVAYAFILLTPDEITYPVSEQDKDDQARKKEVRARPNVIFEFGYFVAKLGRRKVCAIHKGDVAIPSDLNGFIYKRIDNTIEEIGFTLIKELKSAGLKPEL